MTNLKPFNLEKALAGEKVVTRNGREVSELYLFKTDTSSQPLAGLIDGNLVWWTKEGKFLHNGETCHSDLFMAKEQKYGYINIYPNGNVSDICLNRAIADKNAYSNRIDCIQISWDE